ncbi:amidohydrolase [uncultured Friedmanniella sp.]|uniref:amidohydrolase n=1 Tax=uncultured Friedmanniella sp. TaxID=335381 RepID=UPI0035CC0623
MGEPLLLRAVRLGPAGEPCDVLLDGGLVTGVGGGVGGGPGVRVVDLGGRWLLPGLWDEHVHFTQAALVRQRLDVSAATTARQAAALVRARVDVEPSSADQPLVGYGFRDGLWPDRPAADLLDEAGRGAPVVLVSADLHCLWLSTSAALLFDVATDGLLREEAAFAVSRRLDEVPDALVDVWVDQAAQAAAARGVVGVVDLEMAWNASSWVRRVGAGTRSLRVDVGIYPGHLDRALADRLRTGDAVAGGEGLISAGPLKVLIDGSLNTRTACCVEPYPDGSVAELTVPPEELLALLLRATAGGLVPAVHAIGDRAVTAALDVFEALGSGGRIEHAQLVTDTDLPRFAALGVTASVQPEHAMDDRGVADVHWAGRTGRAFPLRSLLDAGARLALGSDAPVSPLDPWRGLAAAVGRARDGLAPWHPEQAISVADALAASARGQRHVRCGARADLVAVDVDPWSASPDQLRQMPVALTVLACRATHDAAGLMVG